MEGHLRPEVIGVSALGVETGVTTGRGMVPKTGDAGVRGVPGVLRESSNSKWMSRIRELLFATASKMNPFAAANSLFN